MSFKDFLLAMLVAALAFTLLFFGPWLGIGGEQCKKLLEVAKAGNERAQYEMAVSCERYPTKLYLK